MEDKIIYVRFLTDRQNVFLGARIGAALKLLGQSAVVITAAIAIVSYGNLIKSCERVKLNSTIS